MNIKIFLGRVFSFRNAKTAALALAGIAVFLFAVGYGLSWYEQWKGQQRVRNLAETLKKIEAEDYKLAMADTYGGKTPQETLDLFITAVEKGDYELASKYFIQDKQKKWKDELIDIKKSDKLDIFLKPLLESKNIEPQYSTNKETASIYGSVLISFTKYPNGNWKIIEI